jgi:hypothetical protein
MLPFIGLAIGAVGKLAGSWLQNRREKAAHNRELKGIKLQGKVNLLQAKEDNKLLREQRMGQMDATSMNAMALTWKDEYILILLSVPVIMCFIPPFTISGTLYDAQAAALTGFRVLNQCPDWYKWALSGVIAAVYGLRTWKSVFKR